jgi:methionyl-tRNA formyltransferase
MTNASAVVFAYHNVGVRCLSVLLDQGVRIPLVVTHRDSPQETIWFASVADLARSHELPVIMPDNVNDAVVVEQIAKLQPDFLFSFYYRQMLKPALLGTAKCGAYNMHGSLLPKYRGRVPVNWAIINGERETGATLHQMVEKPDAGHIVDQQAVPILENDNAQEVFNKVTVAAEIVLHRALPGLIAGTARLTPQDLSQGGYFAGRKAEDGAIDWNKGAREVHNLVRALAPPYPGAFEKLGSATVTILRTRLIPTEKYKAGETNRSRIALSDGKLVARCGDGNYLEILELDIDGQPATATEYIRRFTPAS